MPVPSNASALVIAEPPASVGLRRVRLAGRYLAIFLVAVGFGLLVPQVGVMFAATVALGLAAVLTLGYLALNRFEWFVWVVLLTRPVIDLTKGDRGGNLDSSSGGLAMLFGGAVILVGGVWIAALARNGQRLPFGLISRVLLLLMATSVISVLNSEQVATSAGQVARTLGAVMLFLVLEQLLRTRARAARGLCICALAAAVPLAVGAVQIAIGGSGSASPAAGGGDAVDVADGLHRVTGTFLHANTFGFFLVVVLLMGYPLRPYVQRRTRWVIDGLLVVSAIELVFTYSRGSWLVLVVGAVVVGALADRRIFIALPVAGIGAALFVPNVLARLTDLFQADTVAGAPTNSGAWRLAHIEDLLGAGQGTSLFGIGPKMTDMLTAGGRPPHNDAVRLLIENGVVGLTLYLAFLVALVVLAVRALRRLRIGFERGLAVGYVGTVVVFLCDSMGANLITQFVLLIYILTITAIVQAWVNTAEPIALDRSREPALEECT